MPRVVVQHLRLAGPPEACETLLEEVRALAEQHAACRLEVAVPFELELVEGGGMAPERLAAAAQRIAAALERGNPAEDPSPLALALVEGLGACAVALRRADRVALLDALVAVAVAAVRGVEALDGDHDATPLARVLTVADELEVPDGTERAWVAELVAEAGAAIDELREAQAPWGEPWRAGDALVGVAASALQALAQFGS